MADTEERTGQMTAKPTCRELEQRVADRTAQLTPRTQRLAETNVTLKVLLEKREEDKKEMEGQILFNLEKRIRPHLKKLRASSVNAVQEPLIDIVEANFGDITSSFANHQNNYLSGLTPTQIQIADLIKQGQTTKEIAAFLNLSPATIACHRQEIRKRLSLTNQKINLRTALSVNS